MLVLALTFFTLYSNSDDRFKGSMLVGGVLCTVLIAIGLSLMKTRGKSRRYVAFAAPLILIGGIFLWMRFYVVDLSDLKKYHAHGFAIAVIFAGYVFEKLNPLAGLASGLGTTVTYLFLRYYYGLLGEEILAQILIQCSITNILGYYVCLTNGKSDRKQFMLTRELEAERFLSDELLKKILPADIAADLRSGKSTPAASHASVSIIFADLVGFTDLTSRTSPNHLIEILNDIFSMFDRLAETYGVEKIKTIGDGYMAVTGCPKPLSDHAPRAAAMALAMRSTLKIYAEKNQLSLELRIGIHSGQVIAGVIGEKRFGYDIWGDAVNIASRMESTAAAGDIQVSASTAELIGDFFCLSDQKPVSIKGKGIILTHQLLSERTDQPFLRTEKVKQAA